MRYSTLMLFFLSPSFISCSGATDKAVNNELYQFAKAHCFSAYFKKKNYDQKDIRAITGGIFEMGSYSAEKYQAVVELVEKYKPEYSTKHSIDNDLFKCFKFDSDPAFMESLEKIKND